MSIGEKFELNYISTLIEREKLISKMFLNYKKTVPIKHPNTIQGVNDGFKKV